MSSDDDEQSGKLDPAADDSNDDSDEVEESSEQAQADSTTYQIDQTEMDVFIVDENGNSVGRPIVTALVDSYSRQILATHVDFESKDTER
jgi:hypothetical protein